MGKPKRGDPPAMGTQLKSMKEFPVTHTDSGDVDQDFNERKPGARVPKPNFDRAPVRGDRG